MPVPVPVPSGRRRPARRRGGRGGRGDGPLATALRGRIEGEVRFDDGSRAVYATDASNYRQVPIGVVLPRTLDDVVATVATCREHGVPVLSRGGGTSLAGECCNVAVVMDLSRHLTAIEHVDAGRRVARVQPGVVLDALNARTRRDCGLVFGPRPATHAQCTIGGMVGNNSCGATAQWSGTTDANVERLEILTYDGARMWVGPTPDAEYRRILAGGGRRAEIHRRLRELRDRHADRIRAFPDLPRRVSGFNLPALLPENGFQVAQALVGSESTCVTVLRAELRLLPEPAVTAMVVLGYPDVIAAARAVPAINPHRPFVLEGLDATVLRLAERRGLHRDALSLFPPGGGWLMVQFGADSAAEARDRADALRAELESAAHPPTVTVLTDPADQARVFALRESGLGATARLPGDPDTWPGWEDSAVPPERLADYLTDLVGLQREFGYGSANLYGHFGHGCVHTRIPFDLVTAAGVADFRRFMERAADLVVSHGGSLSGEHGDGQARGELLDRMYGADGVALFQEFKAVFDPDNRMNPGKVVHARPLDADLRLGPGYAPAEPATHFGYPEDGHSFARAANRCVGAGQCRRHEGGVMCPSYMVTREEEHSTRGRARLLFEMVRGETVTDGWRSEAVHDALDLCLACKGCRSDCPAGVDLATYKAEFLAHHYAHRLRPRDHYSLGWLPLVAELASHAPGLANAVTHLPGISRLVMRAAGLDPLREIPRFSRVRFATWASRRPRGGGQRGPVVLWPDTFTRHFSPSVAMAAVEVLEAAGFSVEIPTEPLCCGLTWISTGQLGVARRVLRRTVDHLAPYLHAGLPVVGLEPSCTAVFRSDAAELLDQDQDVLRLRRQTVTLAELLARDAPDFAPRLPGTAPGVRAVIQTHCHQHAVTGFDADVALMRRIGLDPEVLDSGCCGLAGNFGMVPEHREVSLACAERVLLPAVRDADPRTVVLADGFSCRTQIADAGTGRHAVHLAEVLAAAVRGEDLGPHPEGEQP
ncbi:MAG: FAD-binding protein [Actinomycetales bacterium]|nr:FAD-binding protein [Actinomycetales bacterium]